MFVLELLGTLSLRGDARPVPTAAQQKRPLGLLAVLALAGGRGLSRDRIEAYLWPESAGAPARHSLEQTVYACRHALGSDVILASARELRLNPDLVHVDVWQFDDAIRAGQWSDAVDRYTGALLDGMHLADSRELEAWIDAERARLLNEYQRAVEHLAGMAEGAGDHAQLVGWCRRLANSDPLSAGVTMKLMRALASAGDRAGAVRQARLHQQLVRQQLEMEPDAEVEALAASVSRGGSVDGSRPERSEGPAFPKTGPSLRSGRQVDRAIAVALVALLAVSLFGAATVASRRSTLGAGVVRAGAASSEPEARRAYRRALDAWTDGSRNGLDTAVVYFHRAIDLDRQNAEAYAGLADAYVMLGYFGYHPGAVMFPEAKVAALESMRLDSTLAAPHPALAYALTWERDFVRADSEYRKAVTLEPSGTATAALASSPDHVRARLWYPVILMLLAQKNEAGSLIRSAAAEEPWALHDPVLELTFTKWFDTYPAMAGFTSNGPGTMKGEVLSRVDDGSATHLVARYEITDPQGPRSFKTVIQGTADNSVGRYDLNGVVAWGWMTGAHVRATFRRISPCRFGKLDVCYQGTIQLQRR
jgi:DNA-binding SARP family transcriptional activator